MLVTPKQHAKHLSEIDNLNIAPESKIAMEVPEIRSEMSGVSKPRRQSPWLPPVRHSRFLRAARPMRRLRGAVPPHSCGGIGMRGMRTGIRARPRAKKKGPPPVEEEAGPGRKRFAPRYFPALLNAVSSPRGALTAVFGMGTGVTPPVGARTKRGQRDGQAPCRGTAHSERGFIRGARLARLSIAPAPRRACARRGADGVQASRPIRSGMLNASRRLRIRPVKRVVFPRPSGPCGRDGSSPGGLGA